MFAALSWWIIIELFAVAALPVAWRFFARLPGRGYPLAKALGLLLVSFVLWLGAIFHVLPNDVGGIVVALLVTAALSGWLGRSGLARSADGSRPLLRWLRANLPLVIATEVLFLLVFAGWTAFRAYNPEISATEKPMEFAFINGVLRSRFFPPQDPWLSGYAISYYYFGYVMLGVLIRLSGVDPAVGFNLGVALWYALVLLGAFAVVYDLVRLAESRQDTSRAGRGIAYGLLGALFAGVIGNLEGFVELAYYRGWAPLSWIKWLDIKDLAQNGPTGAWTGGFWWWWRASRVVHDKDLLGNSVEVIDEFPLFSFLLGDLHPHVLALPFALLAVALALNMLLGAQSWQPRATTPGAAAGDPGQGLPARARGAWLAVWHFLGDLNGLGAAGAILSAVLLGGLAFLNTWDFPIYVAVVTLSIGIGLALQGGLTWAGAGRALGAGIVLAMLGWVLYLPFYFGFQSQLGGVLPNLLFPTRLSQYMVMFGPFLAVSVFFLALASMRGPEANAGAAPIGRRVLRILPLTLLGPLAIFAVFYATFALLPQGQTYLNSVLDNPAVQANVAGRSMGQLVGLVGRIRLANPWTYLFLAGMIAWAGGLLWARLAAHRPAGLMERKSDDDIAAPRLPESRLQSVDLFAVLLIGMALLLTFAVEFVYLRDLFGTRMNTVFKFYYQAWAMLAVAAAYGLSRLAGPGVRAWLKWPALILAGLLAAAALVYPASAIPSKADGFRNEPTLDGLAYLRQSNPADVSAIEWIRANVPPDAVVLEATGGSYSPEGAERISMSTGNPTLLGWDFHERQWRGNRNYDRIATGRADTVEQIYRTIRSEELGGTLERWGIDYVYIGALERQKYKLNDATVDRFDTALQRVYNKDGVRIYAR